MKRELFILAYVVIMGAIIVSTVSFLGQLAIFLVNEMNSGNENIPYKELLYVREGANKQVISSQADSLIKISRIWADFFPANTS
ncbi:hypothetical protein M9457_27275, partial [Klebsiella pneumoniae]|nr:hypothetical protein [Klebsiella pneumoniae]